MSNPIEGVHDSVVVVPNPIAYVSRPSKHIIKELRVYFLEAHQNNISSTCKPSMLRPLQAPSLRSLLPPPTLAAAGFKHAESH